MSYTERNNPVAARAACRRLQWEIDAAQQPKPGFFTRKRFDFVDAICFILIVGGFGVLLGLVA